jgi:hypothetical protein
MRKYVSWVKIRRLGAAYFISQKPHQVHLMQKEKRRKFRLWQQIH